MSEPTPDLAGISDLGELQLIARANTRELNQLRGLVAAERDPKVSFELQSTLKGRQIYGGAIIRRRQQLEDAKQAEIESEIRRKEEDLRTRLNLPDLERRTRQLVIQIAQLAEDADHAARRAQSSEEGREQAGHLHSLARVCLATQEALRRVGRANRFAKLDEVVRRAVDEGRR